MALAVALGVLIASGRVYGNRLRGTLVARVGSSAVQVLLQLFVPTTGSLAVRLQHSGGAPRSRAQLCSLRERDYRRALEACRPASSMPRASWVSASVGC